MRKKLLLIDGNSIMNRAFYGILTNKMLAAKDGTYTNAVYGFLAILFKNIEEVQPDYMAVSFDLKGKTARHEMYSEYKANRHGMPDELAMQMPMIKEVLNAMHIDIVEKEGYEGDDILGTLSKYGEAQNLDVFILSGDRDTFQLASNRVTIRIPRTKQGKTETEEYNKRAVKKEYGLEPKDLIEVKGLQGDTSDNIPGVPGIGPKTAISLIKRYGTVENLYKKIEAGEDDLKGKQREAIIENKEMALLSRKLGEIDVNVPIDDTLENLKVEEWDKPKVLELFKAWNFKRYIERFNLEEVEDNSKEAQNKALEDLFKINTNISFEEVLKIVQNQKKIIFYLGLEENQNQEYIIKQDIKSISIYNEETNEVYYITNQGTEFNEFIKVIFEDEKIEKIGYELGNIYIILKQQGITMQNLKYDIAIASYIIDVADGKYQIDKLIDQYLELSVDEYLEKNGAKQENIEQMTLFENSENNVDSNKYRTSFYAYCIFKLSEILTEKLKKIKGIDLFQKIDMPVAEVLADMQWNGMHIEEEKLIEFGKNIKDGLDLLTSEIYNIAGEEFNINSPKQLGEILFEKMGLTAIKKTKKRIFNSRRCFRKIKKRISNNRKNIRISSTCKIKFNLCRGDETIYKPKNKKNTLIFPPNNNSNRKNKLNRTKSTKHTNKNRFRQEVKKSIYTRRRQNLYRCRLFSNRIKSISSYVK